MRKILAIAAMAACCIGCTNDNKITIENDSQTAVYFNFRAQIYTIYSGEIKDVPDEIPNGTYDVNIGIEKPPEATTWGVSPEGASFTFQKKSTKYRAQFGSTLVAGVYSVKWNYTSTDNKGSVTSP
jgi:hypothetical protein